MSTRSRKPTGRYQVLTELSYPKTDDGVRRAQKGEMLDRSEMKVAAVGTIATDIPEVSIPWLLEAGHIVAAGEDES